MPYAPVARVVCAPAVLPIYDPDWKRQCLSCAHCKVRARGDYTTLHCALNRRTDSTHPNAPQQDYCIDYRHDTAPCGPQARLRAPLEGTSA